MTQPTRELLTYFDDLHRYYRGERAVIRGGKDAKLVGELCRTHGELRVKQLMCHFFTEPDRFIRENGYTVGLFVSQAAKLMARHPVAREAPEVDWWDDCKAKHDGACGSRRVHATRCEVEDARTKP